MVQNTKTRWDEAYWVDIEVLEKQFQKDRSADVYLPLARTYIRVGDPLKAIEILKKGLAADDNFEGRLLLARAYFDASAFKRKYLQNASEIVDELVRQNPNSWEVFLLKGEIALEEDNVQAAIEALKKANELNPEHPQPRMLLRSLGVEPIEPEGAVDDFYVDVAPELQLKAVESQRDSFLGVFRDIAIVFALAFLIVGHFASKSIQEKKIHALIFLGRTQQKLDTYTGLKNATHIYKTILEKLDSNYPFANIHLAEVHYALWERHNRTKENLDKFRKYFDAVYDKKIRKEVEPIPNFHALVALMEYSNALKEIQSGKYKEAKSKLEAMSDYLKKKKANLPPHARLDLVHGMIFEILGKSRYARAMFKRAAEFGWDSPFYRWRLAYFFLRIREFAAAHHQFMKAEELAKQNTLLVERTMSEPSRQKNEYCWIDPPMLLGDKAPPGLQLGLMDLLTESLVAALKSEKLSKCPFHTAIREKYKANPYYILAPIGDVISILDSGVGMSVGFKLARELKDKAKKVKEKGDFSPHSQGWYHLALAKSLFYQDRLEEALKEAKEGEKYASYEPYILSLIGAIQIRLGKLEEGKKYLYKAIEYDPYLLQIYYEGGLTLLNVAAKSEDKKKYIDEISKFLERMHKHFKDHTDYLYLRGKLALLEGDENKAEEFWKKALDPDKPPYFGEHYEVNLEMGKLYLNRARKYNPEKKYTPKDYPELLKAFKKYLNKIYEGIDDRLIKKEDNQKAKEDYKKFLEMLEKGQKIKPKDMKMKVADLQEALYKISGEYLQKAMQVRPGAVESRFWTGMIFYENKNWTDCFGHFSVAAKGYLRDLRFKDATETYIYLANSLAYQVYGEAKRITPRMRKDAAKKISDHFKREKLSILKTRFLRVKAKKEKDLPPYEKAEVINSLKAIKAALEKIKGLKLNDIIEEYNEDISILEKKGILEWGKREKERQLEAQQGGKKKKRRRRRRR